MKAILVFAGLLLLPVAIAQQRDGIQPYGVIYGTATEPDGSPAKAITLVACPQGVVLATVLPRTKTNDAGEYRFENIPWWGKYRVYAEDDDVGYSAHITGPGRNEPPEVTLTPQHREAQLTLYLPPKAGFLHIHLTNRRTGNLISGMEISVMSMKQPDSLLCSMSCSSNHVVLLPPNKDVFLHVTSKGFKEWDESVGIGKIVRLNSGAESTLDVQLEPTE